jgi:hypothetical protein
MFVGFLTAVRQAADPDIRSRLHGSDGCGQRELLGYAGTRGEDDEHVDWRHVFSREIE